MIATEVRNVLDLIDTALATLPIDDSRDLWTILTALRGPDDDLSELGETHRNADCDCGCRLPRSVKQYTTAPIRAAAFPKLLALHGHYSGTSAVYVNAGQALIGGTFDISLLPTLSHFGYHTRNAAILLDLTPAPEEP